MFRSDRYEVFTEVTGVSKYEQPAMVYGEQMALEDELGIVPAEFYLSTAITSGGYYRDPVLRTDIGRVIAENTVLGAQMAEQLVADNPDVNSGNIVLPTEVSKMPDWHDSHYMLYWFYNIARPNSEYAEKIDLEMQGSKHADVITTMDCRSNSHDVRWQAYQEFTAIVVGMVSDAKGAPAGEALHSLVQVVDTDLSLGCRAEELFARARGMDIFRPVIDVHRLPEEGDFRTRVEHLQSLGAHMGPSPVAARLGVVNLGR